MSSNPYPVFRGSIPALITPMLQNGEVDFEAFKKLVDWHVQEKSDGLVIIGTSGESPTIDFKEHAALLSTAVEFAGGRIPIIAGVGGNSTKEALHLTQEAKSRRSSGSIGRTILQ
ncbi:Dihydrodipicolinate synthase [Oligella ureolytica]|nr:Dihydrodipicolinate synthase [Oligella ureolytica]